MVLVPLLSIVTITMVKDLYEDQMRKKADRAENERLCETFNHRQVREAQWQEVKQGDIVKIYQGKAYL